MKYYYMRLDKKAFWCLKQPTFEGDPEVKQITEEEWRAELNNKKHK